MIRAIYVATLLGCMACRSKTPPTPTPELSATTVSSTAPSARPASASPHFRRAAVEREDKVCKDGKCFCAAPLGCGRKDQKPCITYDENVDAFRTALKGVGTGKDRRTVTCNQAEVGTCAAYRYFYFDGDIHRTELRFFDEKGVFMGEVALTDYDEYCDHRASKRVRGAIPDCKLSRTELICGKAGDPSRLVTSLPE